MKVFAKHLISTAVFGLIYILMEFLFTKNIDWKIVIVSSIIYGIIYPIIDFGCAKLISKK